MEDLVGKEATIGVDYLWKEDLHLGDPVEILGQREEDFFLGKRVVLRVKSLIPPRVEKEVLRSEVAYVRPKHK